MGTDCLLTEVFRGGFSHKRRRSAMDDCGVGEGSTSLSGGEDPGDGLVKLREAMSRSCAITAGITASSSIATGVKLDGKPDEGEACLINTASNEQPRPK